MEVKSDTCVECGQPATRACVRCGRPLCNDDLLYRGSKQPPDAKMVTCGKCDYEAFLNTYGGM